MPDTTVGSAGDGAPLPAREPRPRRLPNPLNGTEQRLDALLEVLDEVLHELRELRLDSAGLDQVKEDDPVLELTEPTPDGGPPGPTFGMEVTEPTADPVVNSVPPAPAEPLELVEPAPGPARAAARPTKKRAKKAPPRR